MPQSEPSFWAARARSCPSRFREPFGLAAVEAMACGTPVVALRRGAADEVIDDGKIGIVVDDEDDLAEAVGRALTLDRAACRAHVAARFSHVRMAAEYEKLASHIVAEPTRSRFCRPARRAVARGNRAAFALRASARGLLSLCEPERPASSSRRPPTVRLIAADFEFCPPERGRPGR